MLEENVLLNHFFSPQQTSRSSVGRAASCAARAHPRWQRACALGGDKPPPAIAPRFLRLLSCWGLGRPELSFSHSRQRGEAARHLCSLCRGQLCRHVPLPREGGSPFGTLQVAR